MVFALPLYGGIFHLTVTPTSERIQPCPIVLLDPEMWGSLWNLVAIIYTS